jgi:hypothetical protein
MSGSARRPGRRRAAPAALRYEHRAGRPPDGPPARKRDFSCALLLLMVIAALAFLVPMAMADRKWGDRVWGELAPGWPGGAYAFAVAVGAVVPLALAALIAPLTRMKWRTSKVRSLGWAAASLPGLAACWVLTGVILETTRPKHRRNWDADCYSKGHPCWVHVQYPWIWAVGLLATLVVAALLVLALVRLTDRATPPAT